jgi:hypothetical protein
MGPVARLLIFLLKLCPSVTVTNSQAPQQTDLGPGPEIDLASTQEQQTAEFDWLFTSEDRQETSNESLQLDDCISPQQRKIWHLELCYGLPPHNVPPDGREGV